MANPSKAIVDFMAEYGVGSDEIWCVHGKTWVVLHKALERVAAEKGIVFGPPTVTECDTKEGIIALWVPGQLGERKEWAFGEASPKNNKNSYPWAMAEKRAKDRVILKLLNTHGAIYSEEEADDFKRPNPHVNRASDFHEEFSADIPDVPAAKMKVKDARPAYDALKKEMWRIQDPDELREWGSAQAETINSFGKEWADHFRAEYSKHQKSLVSGKAA